MDARDMSGRYHRLLLDRLLGSGTHELTDSSELGQTHRIEYKCGCRAERADGDLFRVAACDAHRASFPA